MSTIHEKCNFVGWNGIALSCPKTWETIVSGDSHLLFEEDFKPVFELRWHEEKRHSKRSIRATLQKIADETGLPVRDTLPPHWKKIEESYAIRLLNDSDNGELKAAILICKTCGTTLLLYFFDNTATSQLQHLTAVILSIRCHTAESTDDFLWAVQDFQILIPESFTLIGHNFGAGLSRLSFRNSSLTLHVCRIAGASQRLKASSLITLMNLLGDIHINEEDVQHQENIVSHCASPSIFQQIRCRLKRKQPFHQATLRYHPEYDRLSGLFFFDRKPISKETSTRILNSYEIHSL